MYRRQNTGFFERHKRMLGPIILVGVFLLGAFLFYVWSNQRETSTNDMSSAERTENTDNDIGTDEVSMPVLPSVQAELDEILHTVRGTHSVLVEDLETGETLASYRENETYFTASIYKLYVAYMGLLDIQDGKHNPDEPYNQGRTRQECIEVMLRDSDSPCPEQMWVEQGREAGNARLAELGLKDTDLLAITTTPRDANIILSRLYQGLDLNEEHRQIMLDALIDFPERDFRQGLPSALNAVDDIVVYDKPGLYDEGWLDSAIIELPSGRSIAVSIFSDSAYYQEVRAIADAIIAPLIAHER